ncbi:hypothetical protein FRB99_001876, partial [Tulasnella sp. 403]
MTGHKKLCKRLTSTAVQDALDLAATATKYGVKNFLGDVSPLNGYIEQLKAVQSLLDEHDTGAVAAFFQNKKQINVQIDSVLRDLNDAHNDAKQALLLSASDPEPPFDLYEKRRGDRGGFSEVIIGDWRPLTSTSFRKVAVKHIRPKGIDLLRTPEAEVGERMLKRLLREVEPWKSVSHRHILPFLGYSTTPHWILLSPWCDNGDLISYAHNRNMKANKPRLLAQAASGLHWLHTRQPPIVHADVKPDNILVNDIHEAVISDFGLSRIIHEGPSGFTTELMGHGAPLYMAPEQHDDTTAGVTIAIDIYAFTLVALEVLSGRRPFQNTRKHIVLAVQGGERPVLEDHPGSACNQLWDLFECGWNQSPTTRPLLDIFIKRLNEIAEPP